MPGATTFAADEVPSLNDIGFEPTSLLTLKLSCAPAGAAELLDDFLPRIGDHCAARDLPAIKGPNCLSTHLRFDTESIRRLAREAHDRAVGAPHRAGPRPGCPS